MMKIVSVVGARPQFIKAAPLSVQLRKRHDEVLVHTGQHYDEGMSAVFFDELAIPAPDHTLGVGSGTHARQTAAMMIGIEDILTRERPDAVLVYGDTNSTIASALAAAKLHIRIAHVEAGLRSFNRALPEEINRVVTDRLAHWLFVPAKSAALQLAREGITEGVYDVGDIMLDASLMFRDRAGRSDVLQRLDVPRDRYYLATIHRAENTDDRGRLTAIIDGLAKLSWPVVLPLHPRTRKQLAAFGIRVPERIKVTGPAGYLDMLALQQNARCIITDSGGVQKEAYYLGTPCVTVRDETEWTETVDAGWNRLSAARVDAIVAAVGAQEPVRSLPRPPLYGAGDTARRIVDVFDGGGPG